MSDYYAPNVGGTEKAVEQLMHHLEQMGYEVFVLTLTQDSKKAREPGVIRLPSIPTHFTRDESRVLPPWGISRIEKIFDELKLDIIHTQTEMSLSMYAKYYAAKRGIAHVHMCNLFWPGFAESNSLFGMQMRVMTFLLKAARFCIDPKKKYLPHTTLSLWSSPLQQSWRLLEFFIDGVDMVCAPSQHTLDELSTHNLAEPGRSAVTPYFVSPIFSKAKRQEEDGDRSYRILAPGRVSPEKRLDVVIQAFSLLKDDRAELEILGEGPVLRELKHQVATLPNQVRRRIVFSRSIPQPELAQRMAGSGMVVLASHGFETFGLVAQEAIMVGTPLLYCDPKLSQCQDAKAYLAQPDAASVAAGMQAVLFDESVRKQMREDFTKASRQYDPQSIRARYRRLYDSVLDPSLS